MPSKTVKVPIVYDGPRRLVDTGDPAEGELHCPECGTGYIHLRGLEQCESATDYPPGDRHRGPWQALLFRCEERSHVFRVAFQFHKGRRLHLGRGHPGGGGCTSKSGCRAGPVVQVRSPSLVLPALRPPRP